VAVPERDRRLSRGELPRYSTEAMQRHYSTVSGKEQKARLAKVVELAKFRQAARLDPSGEISGEARAETETAVGA
jgi:hypothetical protein